MNKNLKIVGGTVAILAIILVAFSLPTKNNALTPTKTGTEQKQTFQITLSIEHPTSPKTYRVELTEGQTVMDAMEKVKQQYNLAIDVKEYSFGKLIEGIDGVSSNQSAGKYWTFYVNGQMSNVGASEFKLTPIHDTVTWKYGG